MKWITLIDAAVAISKRDPFNSDRNDDEITSGFAKQIFIELDEGKSMDDIKLSLAKWISSKVILG